MPSYDDCCQDDDRMFAVHMSLKDHDTAQVHCVQYQGTQVEQLLTAFVAMTSKKNCTY